MIKHVAGAVALAAVGGIVAGLSGCGGSAKSTDTPSGAPTAIGSAGAKDACGAAPGEKHDCSPEKMKAKGGAPSDKEAKDKPAHD